ncbi:MAG: sulfite exporter TauE/SafE family protein [Bacteroidota bacterium]|jgi:uncharacterized membrane protein YfcA
MSTTSLIFLLLVGLFAGFLSGMVGIGGGILIVPVLVYFFGFSQHKAQGTTLFLFVLPVGILGAYNYYKSGNIDIKTALVICATFVFGSYFGSKLTLSLDQLTVKRIFGIFILLISLKMIWGK